MKWTEGHVWVLDSLRVSSRDFFQYKYVLMRDNKPLIWEQGFNRIADLRALPSLSTPTRNFFAKDNASRAKVVEITDSWETFAL